MINRDRTASRTGRSTPRSAGLDADLVAWYQRVRPRYVIMDEHAALPASLARLQPRMHSVRSMSVAQFW
jgi:hypothetical protein